MPPNDALQKFEDVVRKGVFYVAEGDDNGARVSTNLENTVCARCGAVVQPNVEHLCGNRAKKQKQP
jgi:hypothetical protein